MIVSITCFDFYTLPAIATAQTILFLLEEREACPRGSDLLASVTREAAAFWEASSTAAPEQLFEMLEKCETIHRSVQETLRVTAHAIGAMRKVVAENGWTINVSTESGDVVYVVPKGSYVGASHIVPNVNSQR